MTKKKIKILIIGTTDNSGGAARVGWDIGHELINRKYDVKFIVGYKKSNKNYVYDLKKPKLLSWLDKNTRFDFTATLRHLRSFLLANNIDYGANTEILDHPWYKSADLVHCHNLHGNYFKLEILSQIASEKKLVWTLHDMSAITGKCAYVENSNEWESGYHKCRNLNSYPPMLWDNTKYMWQKKKNIYKKAKLSVVSPSLWLAKIAKKSILKNQNIFVIPNGIDTNIFHPKNIKNIKRELNIPVDKKIILFIAQAGKKDSRKGWKYTASIIDKYRNDDSIHFICIGGGEKNKTKNNITFIPFIEKKEVLAKYYSAADLLLFTSLAENCPLVILEAMACGLPIISFDVGGIRELIENKVNGYIANYLDTEDLNNGIKYVLNLSIDEIKVMRNKNREKAIKQYSIKIMTDRYENLYTSLV
ncbi:MAG: hypothetical protein A2182_00055 [Candidatus Pacebacteria bacterium RIFOXYA1_FULL_38_18]|nr:MAG: hypothetical protein A2182_00055 [Candidatus Pacebacteria bacterium RIFOXYA1_FULL_38_18]OGJ39456.1 MAG: hypothetical protein A2411_01710 [Candidatus Pacebacteria bacterium RIFOXYC1_FULL_39_21]